MRVNGASPLDPTTALSVARSGQQAAATEPSVSRDSLEISGRALEVEKARAAIRDLPDVRQERVSFLREEIRSGRYQVPAEEVAAAMIASIGGRG